MAQQEKKVLKEHEAAELLGLDVTTLRDWRFHKIGPHYLKYLNRSVRYPVAELSRFMAASMIETAA